MGQRGVTTLEAIVADIRMESGRSPDRNLGQDEYDSIAHLARREQERLYWDHDWPFLRVFRDLNLAAGSRYYDAPGDLNFERITNVQTKWGAIWTDLERGITMRQYSVWDSDNDIRSAPALKWDMVNTGTPQTTPTLTTEQIEIWPIPSFAATVRFSGFKGLGPFISDADPCTLDPTIITLYCAAELLARDGRADAQAKLTAANNLYAKMKGAGQRRTGRGAFSMSGREQTPARRPIRIIAVASDSH